MKVSYQRMSLKKRWWYQCIEGQSNARATADIYTFTRVHTAGA